MKKSIVAIFIVIILISCKKEESKTSLHLTGNIKGLKEGKLYIQRIVDTILVAIDTIQIDGESTFKTSIEIKSPEMLYLFLDRGVTNSLDNNIMFFAEAGSMNVDTNLESYISSAKITGSKNHEKYAEYQKMNIRFKDENLELIKEKFLALKSGKTKKIDSLSTAQENNTKRKYLFTTNFAINNRDYEIAPYLALTEIYDINIKYLDTIEKAMNPKIAQSLYGKKLTKYVSEIKARK